MLENSHIHQLALILLSIFVLIVGCSNQDESSEITKPVESTVTEMTEISPTTPATEETDSIQPPNTPTPQAIIPLLNPDVPAKPKGGESCEDYPCFDDVAGWEARVAVPDGFSAEYLTLLPSNPTSITFGPDGLLYAAAMTGTISTINPETGTVDVVYKGFNTPVGTAFRPNSNILYISDRLSNEEARVSTLDLDTGEVTLLFDGVPCCYAGMHAANGLTFGPDEMLYVAVGARADHGEVLNTDQQDELHPWEASVLRVSPDGSTIENYARGLRNAYDIAWDGAGRLFATNNGPDYGPPEALYLVEAGGEHGYPWYECDNCFWPPPEGVELVAPINEFIPHSAPTGITAYTADQFPDSYHNNLFAVLWSAFEGAQKVVRFGEGGAVSADFATGFAAPIDITVGSNGSLYIADWATGVIFKISYVGN